MDIVRDGVRHSVPVRSQLFEGWIYTLLSPRIPTSDAMSSLVRWAAASALASPLVYESHYRIGAEAGVLYYDLGDLDNTVVKIQGGSWEIVPRMSGGPHFVRPSGLLAQVTPVQTIRTLEEILGDLLPTANEGDRMLAISWLLGAFKPKGPFPVLVINGEQGSAKSSTTRLLRRIIDPHSRDMCEPPRGTRDFVAIVKNGYVIAMDNLSKIDPWLSDSLCRVATGTGALGGRTLYTTDDISSFTAARPTILNGIPTFVEREDLTDRAIHLELPEIPENKRRDDDSYWEEIDGLMPEIVGSLLNDVARAHANWAGVKLGKSPRMSNFVRWVVAGLGPDRSKLFLEAYEKKRISATEDLVEHNEVAQAIIAMMSKQSTYSGTMTSLVNDLFPFAPNPDKYWPENAWQMRNKLRRVKPELRKVGIELINNGRDRKNGRTRVEIRKAKDVGNRGYAVSCK